MSISLISDKLNFSELNVFQSPDVVGLDKRNDLYKKNLLCCISNENKSLSFLQGNGPLQIEAFSGTGLEVGQFPLIFRSKGKVKPRFE